MQKNPFIVIEGPDNSGKTYLAERLAKYLCGVYRHEPNFSSAQADELNFSKGNPYRREAIFLADRMRNQADYTEILKHAPLVLDRYIWTGIAYCKHYTPELPLEAYVAIYSTDFFRQPDITIFVDCKVEDLYARRDNPLITVEDLQGKLDAYRETAQYLEGNVTRITNYGALEEAWEILRTTVDKYLMVGVK